MGLRSLATSAADRLARAFGEGFARVRPERVTAERVPEPPAAAPPEGGQRAFSLNFLDPQFFLSSRLRTGQMIVQKPFHTHPWLFSILTSRGDLITQARFRTHARKADGEPGDVLGAEDPLAKLFESPNEGIGEAEFWRLHDLFCGYLGECFWLLDRDDPHEEPRRMWPLAGGSVWKPGPLNETTGEPETWVLSVRGKEIPYESWQLAVFRPIRDPDNPVRGLSPLSAAQISVESDVLADRFTAEFFRSGAAPGGVLQFPGPLTPEQVKLIKSQWQDEHGGAWNAHKFGVLYGGATWQKTQISQRDMEFIELKKWSREALAAAFRWPLWMLTDQSTTYATARESRYRLWNETIIPLLRCYESTVQTQLLNGLARKVVARFDLDQVSALRDEREAKWDTATKMRAAGVSLKECNRVLDLRIEPQPGWDQVLVPLGQIPIEEAVAGAGIPPEPEEKPAAPAPPGGTPEEAGEEEGIGAPAENEEAEAKVQGALSAIGSEGERVAFKRLRLLWRQWWRNVAEPGEARLRPVIRGYLRDLAEAQMKRFDKVAREKERSAESSQTVYARVLGPDDIEAVLFNQKEWDAVLRPAYRRSITEIAKLAEAFTEGELSSFGKSLDFLSPRVQDFLNRRVELVARINTTTRNALARQLAEGMKNEETVQELRARIQAVSDALSDPARALRIARTETGAVANGIRFQFAEPGDRLIWDASDDEIVRPSHAKAEADSRVNPVLAGQPFSNGLLYPHDPGGPASEVIECRCGLLIIPAAEMKEAA